MTDERLAELLPLAAIGDLDGDDRVYVEARLAGGEPTRPDLLAFERVVARIAFETDPVPPSPGLWPRVLKAATAEPAAGPRAAPDPGPDPRMGSATPPVFPPASRRFGFLPTLAAAAAAVLAVCLLVVRSQRDGARRESETLRLEATTAVDQARRAMEERDHARARLVEEQAFRALFGQADSKVAGLGGMPAAPKARAVWSPVRKEAVLLASGLDRAPEGKAYEVWVIAQGAPVPAGTFQVDALGDAMFRLPAIDDVARVKTFAVTLEPAAGTAAPTGPIVLAGAAG